LPQVPQELVVTIEATSAPGALADIITSYIDAKLEEKQDLLETTDVTVRMDKISRSWLGFHRV
jgi:ATP-dependent Lon protease